MADNCCLCNEYALYSVLSLLCDNLTVYQWFSAEYLEPQRNDEILVLVVRALGVSLFLYFKYIYIADSCKNFYVNISKIMLNLYTDFIL